MEKFALFFVGVVIFTSPALADIPLFGNFSAVQKRFVDIRNVMSNRMAATCVADEECRQDLQRVPHLEPTVPKRSGAKNVFPFCRQLGHKTMFNAALTTATFT